MRARMFIMLAFRFLGDVLSTNTPRTGSLIQRGRWGRGEGGGHPGDLLDGLVGIRARARVKARARARARARVGGLGLD